MKILITGGKSALALKMLRAFVQHQVVLADYGEMPNFSSTTYTFISLGEKNEDTIAHTLLNQCLTEGIDLILPLRTFEIEAMAKAKVLFNEFSIDIILPAINDLNSYFNKKIELKPENWAVFIKGETLFMNLPDEELVDFAKSEGLNGAFYLNKANSVANLNLITI